MLPILDLIDTVLGLYLFVLVVQAILSWLLVFGVVNRYNRAVQMIGDVTYRLTEPALRPIRRFVPNVGGLDLSFLVLFLLIYFIRDEIRYLALRYLV
ncbi:MAG TPA: YggT family protein [Stellaceae bacterium]|jgi:YggT family protein|nr:YggT family protein [Stellaceae bacterium]